MFCGTFGSEKDAGLPEHESETYKIVVRQIKNR